MLKIAYHTQKPSVKQEFTPQKRLNMVPVSILATTILLACLFNLLMGGA
jgi:hypothetical protein